MTSVRLTALLAVCCFSAVSQSLSPQQQRLIALVNASEPESLALLEQLVNINSGTLNIEGVRQVAKVLEPRFEAIGFHCRMIPMDEVHRAGHLICERSGTQGKRVLLIGHMDTVFELASPFQKFVRNGDTATGPGTDDMKGGLVIILDALKALHAAGALEDRSIAVVLTGDEERPGEPLSIARRDLIEAGKRSDAAVEFESGTRIQEHDLATIARRSAYSWILKTSAKTGHSGGIFSPEAGDGAIYEMARILSGFHDELREPGLTYNVGLMAGGMTAQYNQSTASATAAGKTNIIPATATATGDLRTVSQEQMEAVRAHMQQIVAKHLPQTSAEIEFKDDGYPSMPATEANKALLRQLNEVNEQLGLSVMEPLDPVKRGAGDLSFVAPYTASISGLGAYGHGAHAEGESVDLSLQTYQARRVALFLYKLTR